MRSGFLPSLISNKDYLEETIYSETKLGNKPYAIFFLWKVRVENHLVDFNIVKSKNLLEGGK
jgi:hypothetical protein